MTTNLIIYIPILVFEDMAKDSEGVSVVSVTLEVVNRNPQKRNKKHTNDSLPSCYK